LLGNERTFRQVSRVRVKIQIRIIRFLPLGENSDFLQSRARLTTQLLGTLLGWLIILLPLSERDIELLLFLIQQFAV